MKYLWMGLLLCSGYAGAQRDPMLALFNGKENPVLLVQEKEPYWDFKVHWWLPVSGTQSLAVNRGGMMRSIPWELGMFHFGDALYREVGSSLGLAYEESWVDMGARIQIQQVMVQDEFTKWEWPWAVGMQAKPKKGLRLGWYIYDKKVSPFLSMGFGKKWNIYTETAFKERGTGLVLFQYRHTEKLGLSLMMSPGAIAIGISLNSYPITWGYGVKNHPYTAFSHGAFVRYEKVD
ncbi:hypothetical protein [Leadbetterella byssophila]|uniref:hypothetical protein n=1 Tax=Leadbetterella byssophila TaxID=316068 RepID=UPI0039A39AFF